MSEFALDEFIVREAVHQRLLARVQKLIGVAQPGPGAEWTQSVPGGVHWELLAVRFQLVTSAAVANRLPTVVVTDAGSEGLRIPANAVQTATLTNIYTFACGIGSAYAQSTRQTASLPSPPTIILGGGTVASATLLLDGLDQYSGIVLTVREWSPGEIVQQSRSIENVLLGLT